MKGKYLVVVQNQRVRYEFEVKRNITIIRGDSATGKTTLIDLLRNYMNLGDESGILVNCKKKCYVLEGFDWENRLLNMRDGIVFIDEISSFIRTEKFASRIKNSDCYYVIITRNNLENLPYSVDEIYGIHSSGKYHDLKHTYNQLYRIYSDEKYSGKISPNLVVVEDSNSGYQFFKFICECAGIDCISANGKSNIISILEGREHVSTLVIADGAAIGPEMAELYNFTQKNKHIKLYLPESFEWLLLKSGLIDGNIVKEILEYPENYIESSQYFSWERYFTAILIEFTNRTYLQYNKQKLNQVYLQDKERNAVLDVMKIISI